MSSLTVSNYQPQLRALPVCGGSAVITYRYAVMICGQWVEINHSFCEWAVGVRLAQGGRTNATKH